MLPRGLASETPMQWSASDALGKRGAWFQLCVPVVLLPWCARVFLSSFIFPGLWAGLCLKVPVGER